MSDRDTVRALIEEIRTVLEADSDLLDILKNPDEQAGVLRFHYLWAPQDQTFPYFTVTASVRAERTEDGYQVVDITMDLWEAGADALRVFDIRKAVLGLLNRRIIECDEFKGRLWFLSDIDLSQPTAEVWRRSTTWELRLFPVAEVLDMKARV